MKAGFGRIAMAWFVDLWVYASLAPVVARRIWTQGDANLPLMILGFFLLRYFFARAFTTPGLAAMAIDIHDRVPFPIAQREDGVTIGLALVTILGGFHLMAIAIDQPVSIPLFGVVLPDRIFAIALFALAILVVAAGYFVSHMLMIGWWMIALLLAFWMLSVTIGWQAWSELVLSAVSEKRAAIGMQMRPGEAEVLPGVARFVLVVPAALLLLLLLGARKQFKPIRTTENGVEEQI